MNTYVVLDVGDPAASSLSSCLRPFPGGFSLLTESGRLRTFFVGCCNTSVLSPPECDEATGTGVDVASAAPVLLLPPSLRGSYPRDKDIPVDHAWSHDGAVLVVLWRESFTVYVRDFSTCNDKVTRQRVAVRLTPQPAEATTLKAETAAFGSNITTEGMEIVCACARSFRVVGVYNGRNKFEGKAIACCPVPAAAEDSGGKTHRNRNSKPTNAGLLGACLIAVGGMFGVECYHLRKKGEVVEQVRASAAGSTRISDKRQQRQATNGDSLETQRQRCKIERDEGELFGTQPSSLFSTAMAPITATTTPSVSTSMDTTGKWTCQALSSVFNGFPVIAVTFSPDSSLLAAAAMTGHVKIWGVSHPRAPPPAQQAPSPSPILASNESMLPPGWGRGKRGQRRKQGQVFQDQRKKGSPTLVGRTEVAPAAIGAANHGFRGFVALWSTTLPFSMPRATSMSFCPDDNATLAVACWDGQVTLFEPIVSPEDNAHDDSRTGTAVRRVGETPTTSGAGDNQGDARAGQQKVRKYRAWKQVHRKRDEVPSKAVNHLEDQDGTFVCWCRKNGFDNSHASESDGLRTTYLAISSYSVTTGNIGIRDLGKVASEKFSSPTSTPEPEPKVSNEAKSDSTTSAGPGLELFTERGVGERIGGVLTGSRPDLTEATAERYLVHGLATGPDFVALYDSDLCLHVVSLRAVLEVGCVLRPPPVVSARPETSFLADITSTVPGLTQDEMASLTETLGADTWGLRTYSRTLADNVGKALVHERQSPRSTISEATLANNDHGLVKAEICLHRGPEEHCVSSEEGLGLSLIWRDAFNGMETPDVGECATLGGTMAGRERGRARLSFLPVYSGRNDDRDGVLAADVRWGRLAVLTRYVAFVYARPVLENKGKSGVEGQNHSKSESREGGAIGGVTGGWQAFYDGPVVHGVLIGGASTTATNSSGRLPRPEADLAHLYLVSILETDGRHSEGSGGCTPFVVIVRSLSDRRLCHRCYVPIENKIDTDGGVECTSVRTRKQGMNVYVSPGYSGGVFVVASPGGSFSEREGSESRGPVCARIWRGRFDEDACRVVVTPSQTISSSPWPPPETLQLQGVAGPNCELILFKEKDVEVAAANSAVDCDEASTTTDHDQEVRWWITWPEMGIWHCVDAPRKLAREDLSVSDFCTIYQCVIEDMVTDYGSLSQPEGAPPPESEVNSK